ncbi:hypothetical protein [Nocardia fluminea]|uniref:hypothetical protein n=1 Tax=Nocardia fluminea TaxID=134984 RepID=UPI0037B0CF09
MAEVDQILELTRKALDSFDDPGRSLAAVVRQGHRIAVRRRDFAGQVWFELQLSDLVAGTGRDELSELGSKLETLLGEEQGRAEYDRQAARYMATRTMANGKDRAGVDIEQLEATCAHIQETYNSYGIPPAGMTQIDTALAARDYDQAKAKLVPMLGEQRAIISRIRQGAYAYLTATEVELEAGRAESGFFDQVQAHINGLLAKYAPEAAQNFVGAQERIASGSPEDISHALTSCRRMIKSLADRLYPATDEKIVGLDNVERSMSDEKYKNRLSEYVREQVGKHKNGEVLQSVLSQLGARLNALDGLASKGVHADTAIDEARTCVAQTYLLAGDLLSIAEGTSPLLQGEPDIATV